MQLASLPASVRAPLSLVFSHAGAEAHVLLDAVVRKAAVRWWDGRAQDARPLRFSMALGNHGARDRNRMPLYFPAAVLDEHTHDLATVFVPIIGAPPPAARACVCKPPSPAHARRRRS